MKAANTFAADVLGADPREGGGRRVLFVSGDDAEAKSAVGELFDAAGFFPIDVGDLVTGGGMHRREDRWRDTTSCGCRRLGNDGEEP